MLQAGRDSCDRPCVSVLLVVTFPLMCIRLRFLYQDASSCSWDLCDGLSSITLLLLEASPHAKARDFLSPALRVIHFAPWCVLLRMVILSLLGSSWEKQNGTSSLN